MMPLVGSARSRLPVKNIIAWPSIREVLRAMNPLTMCKAVLEDCKDICRVDMAGKPSLYFDHIEKEVDCHALMTNAAIDAPMLAAEPPQELPPEMVAAFTYGGKVQLVPFWGGLFNQRYVGEKASREGEEGVSDK